MTHASSFDVRQLRYFVAVAEERSLSRAAQRLSLSQPPLTRQIHQLEQAVGAALFKRSTHGMQLTEPGEVFLKDARNVLLLMMQAAERVRSATQGRLGRIDIAAFGSLILGHIPELLARFRSRHPQVEVVLHTMNHWNQIEALQQGRLTVAFTRHGSDVHGLARETFCFERMMVALSRDDPLAARKRIGLAQLADRGFIMQGSGPRPNRIDAVIALCDKAGFRPRIEQTVGDSVSAVALVAAGFGVSLVPGSVTCVRLPGVVYVPLQSAGQHMADLDCIYRQDDDSAVLQTFLRELRSFGRPRAAG